jgi:polysaccharide export outer membrane protein
MLLSMGLLSGSLTAFGQPGVARLPSDPPPVSVAKPADQNGLTPPPEIAPDYILGNQDNIQVTVWKEPTLSGGLIVRPDGKISLPLVGDLQAAGKMPMQLASDIADHLKKFINDPTVTVTVTAVNSQRIYFVGEVGHPGPMPLLPNMTMLQAISAAGGLTPYANRSKIYILRGQRDHQKKLFFDYKKALKQGDEQGLTLIAGDTVVVP